MGQSMQWNTPSKTFDQLKKSTGSEKYWTKKGGATERSDKDFETATIAKKTARRCMETLLALDRRKTESIKMTTKGEAFAGSVDPAYAQEEKRGWDERLG